MAWTTLTAGMRSLMKYWGQIVQAATAKAGVSGAWAGVKEGAALATAEVEGATIFDMNALYGLAAANREAGDRFMAAPPTAAFDPAWAGTTPAARTPAARFLSPTVRVRVNYTYLDEEGNLQNDWFSTVLEAPGTLTKTQILSTMETVLTIILRTTTATREYHGALVGINTVQLTWL